MERPPKKYVCEKCGYLGDTSEHEGCDYLAWTTGEQLYIDQLERDLALLKASPASAPEGFTMSEPTILPDGSGFGTMSFPLPKDHWIYKEREYEDGAIEPNDLPAPILTHSFRRQVIAAIRYAVRSATNCGKEDDFDPDALVQNAVYALCGPYGKAAPTPPVSEDRKDAERYLWLVANSFDKSGVTQFHIWKHSWEPHSKTGEQIEWSQRIRGPALDTFIDAAMQEDKP